MCSVCMIIIVSFIFYKSVKVKGEGKLQFYPSCATHVTKKLTRVGVWLELGAKMVRYRDHGGRYVKNSYFGLI